MVQWAGERYRIIIFTNPSFPFVMLKIGKFSVHFLLWEAIRRFHGFHIGSGFQFSKNNILMKFKSAAFIGLIILIVADIINEY